MGFGDFESICRKTAVPLCSLVGPPSGIAGSTGIQPDCYSRSIELANTIIFQGGTDTMHILALIMTVVMVIHVRSKFTAVGQLLPRRKQDGGLGANIDDRLLGRKEITTFFYIYMVLTICSLILDSGVIPPGSPVFPYVTAVQNGLTSALCMCLLINGFVGFQLYEDGTRLSVWLLRLSSLAMFLICGAVSLCTFKGWAGLGPTKTIGLFVVLYLFDGICLLIYVLLQVILVINTLQDRWPLGDIAFGVFFFVIGQVTLYVFGDTICNSAQHYLDGLFVATICNLLAVMMVYKVGTFVLRLRSVRFSDDSDISIGIPSPRKTWSSAWAPKPTPGK